MKFSITEYVKRLLYIILLPVLFVVTVTVFAVIVLFEKIFNSKKAPSQTYHQLTSWEDDSDYTLPDNSK